ncbi:phage Gp37/Gp68 family protein [Variovorax sp. ZS18.2.2]|uniref:phage Gp37/Gp68 family protein n=1 Tax=Variovorax sp. ZS18.2.2 TaxID=2971255 RepID=UPI0021508946|nr:phage Gp37/Gp68 family protein [Variovorax sp. ZS18.2.2]MCR6480993.1 phage Gp37/Gp68 family protein [Variovorax sp. ZS18.2.2]
MSANSKIEWTDHTFNPWIGCTKVSNAATGGGGCDHCYAEVSTPARVLRSKGKETWGTGAPRIRTSEANWKLPLRWNAQHAAFFAQHGRRQRVFCASLADVFDNAVAPAWRVDLIRLIEATPNLDWLLLTKRIGNALGMVPHDWLALDGWPAHVWLGATVVNQVEADRDIPKLLAVPARMRFLSMEPLLGPVDLRLQRPARDEDRQDLDGWCSHITTAAGAGIKWVIAGGESGFDARPMHPAWARSLRDQCEAAGVPYLFKQWGAFFPKSNSPGLAEPDRNPDLMIRIGKKAAGRLLDGREWNEVPHVAA